MLAAAVRFCRPVVSSVRTPVRLLSVAPPVAPPAAPPAPPTVDPPPAGAPKEKTGFFLVDHGPTLGFLAALGMLSAYIWRTMKGTEAREALRDAMEAHRAVSPDEISEVRAAAGVSIPEYAAFVGECAKAFPAGFATVDDFERLLVAHVFPDGTIPKQHHFERAYLTLFRPGTDPERFVAGWDGEEPTDDAESRAAEQEWIANARHTPTPVRQLLVLYSYVVRAEAEERLELLLDLFNSAPLQADGDRVITNADLETLLDSLRATWQLPTKTRILEVAQWPVVAYRERSSAEHLDPAYRAAKLEAAGQAEFAMTYGEAVDVLCSKPVCVWNECVPKRRPQV